MAQKSSFVHHSSTFNRPGSEAIEKALTNFFQRNQNIFKNFIQISNLQWELIFLDSCILAPLRQVLTKESDHDKPLQCSIRITASNDIQFINFQTKYQFDESRVHLGPHVLSKEVSKKQVDMLTTLQRLLSTWVMQSALITRFLSSLAQFLKSKSLSVSLLPPGDRLLLRLLIDGCLELKCQLIPRNASGNLLSLTFPGCRDTFIVWNFNFKSIMISFFDCIQMKLTPDEVKSQSQLLKRWALLSEVVNAFLFTNDDFEGTTDDKHHKWTVSLKEPFALYGKLLELLDVKSCQLRLGSTLSIILRTQTNQQPCFIEETHKIVQLNKQIAMKGAKIDQYKGRDEDLFSMAFEILKSWLLQFNLIDMFLTQLSEFLETKQLQFHFLSRLTQTQFLKLEIAGVQLQYNLIPPFSQRPSVIVQASGVIYKIKAAAQLPEMFKRLASVFTNAPRLKRKAPVPPRTSQLKAICRGKEPVGSGSLKPQPGSLLAVMKELKTILTQPSQQPLTGRQTLMEKLTAWQQAGCSISLVSGAEEDESILAQFGNKQLTLQFMERKEGVQWKLRLSTVGKTGFCLVDMGSSSNFYGQLVSCLEHFLEQEPEKFIVVEVKVESEDGQDLPNSTSATLHAGDLVDVKQEMDEK